MRRRLVFIAGLFLVPGPLLAQGQDSTPAARSQQVLAELLPGLYSNSNQVYFDQRRKLPLAKRAQPMTVRITRIDRDDGVYLNLDTQSGDSRLLSLSLDDDPEVVAMTILDRAASSSCVLRWRREAGQFSGASDCGGRWLLSPGDLWITDAEGRESELQRARLFSCYADIPGVAGGRDEPFDRYPIAQLHDQGDIAWITTKDNRELGVTLRNVRWPINNEIGAFTRSSLVMEVLERINGEVQQLPYAWTAPDATRIGINLRWVLVNCYQQSNRDVRPYFE